MKKSTLVIALLILCVVIAVVPLATIKDSEFGGSDDKAEAVFLILIQIMNHGQKVFSHLQVAKLKVYFSIYRGLLVL